MLLRILTVALLSSTAFAQEPAARPQIQWQRTLEDALAISKAEQRPILVAVNMDGESASEQIVRDRYHDAQFVASTTPFVCLIASVFRHTPRDYDEQGRRIPCPRLGEVTCGEHIALEPILYDKYLGTKRIAPRHAVIQLDGTKTFDLYELFDLRELDQQLAEAAAKAPARSNVSISQEWTQLARAKDNQSRSAFEREIASREWKAAIDALREHGDAGSIGALRILTLRAFDAEHAAASPERVRELGEIADRLGVRKELGSFALERLTGLGKFPGSPDLGSDAPLIALAPESATGAERTLLSGLVLTHASEIDGKSRIARLDDKRADGRSMADNAPSTAWILAFARWVRENGKLAPREKTPLADADTLERKLVELDAELARKPDDADVQASFGRTSLALAQRKAETQDKSTQFFFEDARKWLAEASAKRPKDVSLLLDRARAAYQLSKFDEQESLAKQALARMPELPNMKDAAALARALGEPPERLEALRWLGDACARQLGTRSGGDEKVEAKGISDGAWALGLVAASPMADETDWQSYGSFFGAIGLRRDEVAVFQEGATRFPESDALRQALNGALWTAGRVDSIPIKAEWLFDRNPKSGACAWHAGYAHVLAAEDARRREQPDEAIAEYVQAEQRFRGALERAPQFMDSTQHYLAMSALGRGFAHILAGRRSEASQCLGEAIAIRPQIAGVRDGLDREAIDLLDYSLEWRKGLDSPVDPLVMLASLEKADPKNAAWARAIADSELREALRAEGRSDRASTKRYLARSIDVAERAVATDDSEDSKKTLAQSLAIAADIAFEEKDLGEAHKRLVEAATLVAEEAPANGADEAALKALAAKLRDRLGAARPRFRPGR